MRPNNYLLGLLLALLLGGCATTPAPSSTPSSSGSPAPEATSEIDTENQSARSGREQSTAEAVARPSSDGATLALLNQSERAAEEGSVDEALSYAERAVRIDPRRADLWTHLAKLELMNEDPTTAIRYARKALALASDQPDWARDAWLVIADAKEVLGDDAAAAEIRERWRTARG